MHICWGFALALLIACAGMALAIPKQLAALLLHLP
ncbi:hypothetical protein RLEG12_01280 (plasmid) [Rhizobium leguminosarum bv. trifolii CB782]|nr:hypothetical protein RLEG12_01280 [Rhizobium leguminosarum bv. trifolii CB782]